MKTDRSLVMKKRKSAGKRIGPIAGTLALLGIAALVISNFSDIKRYIKISMM
jgi:hypothetical protein